MILLSRPYGGYAAGTIVQFQTATELSLIGQGLGTSSVGPVTPGPVTTSQTNGRVGIAAAGTSVTITGPFTTESKFGQNLSNAAADTTATYVSRVVPAAGSVTFFLNAASTAAVTIDWEQINLSGKTPTN